VDRLGLIVTAFHCPTEASKWNPIEDRLFSEISKTWAGCPLRTFVIAAQYIRNSRPKPDWLVALILSERSMHQVKKYLLK
jgi:hypothetical protein